ncbi:MAG: alpha-glucan family phosphorylase [Chloroflexi bacterium]|nr:alpha-glucan family phosphorylase [Chloroflexota bacterium]
MSSDIAADLEVPLVAVTLLHRKGYFHQLLDTEGNQSEIPSEWSPETLLEPVAPRVSIQIEDREVWVRAWRYSVDSPSGHSVPVYLLDTNLPDNSPFDQTLTDHLYGGDEHYRLCQEVVLGLGGVAMLWTLGFAGLQTYHMNEGHSALLSLALLEAQAGVRRLAGVTPEDWQEIRRYCVFTTHTPVPEGHDWFPWEMVRRVLGDEKAQVLEIAGCNMNGYFNMTHLGLVASRYINGVSNSHELVARNMFPEYSIRSITNGVHTFTWTPLPFRRLFDQTIPDWRLDPSFLRYTMDMPLSEIQATHSEAKTDLIKVVEQRSGVKLDPGTMTIGFARRATGYKRADLIFTDVDRLIALTKRTGGIQLIFAGKAHPSDESGKIIIRNIIQRTQDIEPAIRVVYLEDYDMDLARYICGGVDLWLNTPQKPSEASGTSGMKAALNGVPSLSVLDGWWLEGHVEGITGWSIGERGQPNLDSLDEANSLYNKLEYVILPMFYHQPDRYAEVMRYAIALNGWFFITQRMLSQYLRAAYSRGNGV